MIITTHSGSVYQLDAPRKRIRRLTPATTARMSHVPAGEWRAYADILGPEVGKPLFIQWLSDVTPPAAPDHVTRTSLVTRIDGACA